MKMVCVLFLLASVMQSTLAESDQDQYIEGLNCIGKMLNREVRFQQFQSVSNKGDYTLITMFGRPEKFYYIPGSTRDTNFGSYESKFKSNMGNIAILETTSSGLLLTTRNGKTFLDCAI